MSTVAQRVVVGAVPGALLLKTSLALPLVAAAALALLTWLVYIPAVRREADVAD
jgi:hypothetical protein